MVSLPGDRLDAPDPNPPDPSAPMDSGDWAAWLNTEQMFHLIDTLLPFEACLYHQVLPLSIEGSRMNLGMVNLEDSAALDYIRRILAYVQCSLVPREISSEAHQTLLSSYLNYVETKNQVNQDLEYPGTIDTTADLPPDMLTDIYSLPLPSPAPPSLVNGQATHPTLPTPPAADVVAPPPVLPFIPQTPAPQSPPNPAPFLEEAWPEPPTLVTSGNPPAYTPSDLDLDDSLDNAGDEPSLTAIPDPARSPDLESTLVIPRESPPPPPVPAPLTTQGPPVLEIQTQYLSSPVETLTSLPPAELFQELLGRVLVGGIGRLFFERQAHSGRILWSQNGVLQSALEDLEPDIFQGMINELKQLTNLPLIQVQKPRQVEVERLYQQTRLLLRFRVMLGTYGEEATLQVLRGAALKFHQQQQLTTLSREALSLAKQLQRKMLEIRERTRVYNRVPGAELSTLASIVPTAELEALGSIAQLLKTMDQQIKELVDTPSDQPPA